jgi:hypothetical protein
MLGAYLDNARSVLMRGRPERGRARARAAAAIGHAIAFPTWGSLVGHEGLDATDAVELMTDLVNSGNRR